MAFHFGNIGTNGGGGGGGGTITFTGAQLSIVAGETTTDVVIPAAKYKVKLKNVGPSGGGALVTATVNGEPLFPGREVQFDFVTDWVTKRVLYTPQISIVTNGATIWYEIMQP